MQTLSNEELQRVAGGATVLPPEFRYELPDQGIGGFGFSAIPSQIDLALNSFSARVGFVQVSRGPILPREYC